MHNSKNMYNFYKTDVLVIGGSGAGVSSAIAIAEENKDVLIVSKGKIGKTGNAIMAGGSFSIDGVSAYNYGYTTANTDVTKEVVFDNLVKEGYFLNDQNIVEQFVEESPKVVYNLVKFGEKAGQKFDFSPPGKWFSVGKAWGKALKQATLDHHEVKILEDVMIVDILKNENTTVGAIGYSIHTGEKIIIEARAIVLATGGYQPFSLKNTVTDMTGDGVAMAYRAGASIADMEFLLCFPTALSPRYIRGSIYPYLFEVIMGQYGMQPIIRDGNKDIIEIPQDIVELVKGSKVGKLVSAYYWGHRIFQGKGTKDNGIYYDYSNTPYEKRQEIIERYKKRMAPWHRDNCYMGDDISEIYRRIMEDELIEVGLGYEYSNGGILIDENMRTGVDGLYAAGEVGSGTFGAFRAGDGLTEMLVQGYRAGKNACQYVEDSYEITIDKRELEYDIQKIDNSLKHTKEGISPLVVKEHLEKTADAGFGFIRNEEGLLSCLQELENIENNMLPNMTIKSKSPKYNLELLNYFQVKNLFLCVKAGVIAASIRKESRGSHIRQDYPEVNHDEYLYRILLKEENNKISISKRKPVVTKIDLPAGKDENVMQYFFNEKHNYLRPKFR